MEEIKTLTIKAADELTVKMATLIVGTALQICGKRSDEKAEKSQYIKRTSERLQTVKEICDLIKQLKTHAIDPTDETEQLLELNILMDRLCMCDIPNLPVPLNQHTVESG